MTKRLLIVMAACAAGLLPLGAAAPVHYRFAFPEPHHRWMQVDASFTEIPQAPLELRMSRSSPGRYGVHDFAKNVYDVHAFGRDGRELPTTRPDPSGWAVSGHGGSVTVRYRVYGDRVDGTYLAIDQTHAHINMPAAIMWARGLDDRPIVLTIEQPPGQRWRVATQLLGDRSPDVSRRPVPDPDVSRRPVPDASRRPVPDRFEFTAPNLQYLMDSPVEVGPIVIRQFSVGRHTFRFAVHHTGSDRDVDGLVSDVEQIVRQEGAIYEEYPEYEPGTYTFLADYLPYAQGDGMEHRNSTVMTSSSSIASDRSRLLETVAHEFFHSWNVERIRPRSLEPFDLERASVSGELWLAEGFTQYYGPLVLARAGLVDLARTSRTLTELVDTVAVRPGRLERSLEQMSQMAAFTDGGRPIDRTNWSRTVVSYYSFGGAVALALDLTLRDRSDSRVTLDDFMRAMWRTYGKPGGARGGYVDRPYTMADAEATLGEVSGDPAFARDFFARYIQGHDLADYARLLGRAGLVVRKRAAGQSWLGDVAFDSSPLRLRTLAAESWPIYAAGLEQDDEVERLDGQRIQSSADVNAVLRRHKPGDRIEIVFVDRTGRPQRAGVTLAEDPHLEVVPIESAGGSLTPAQRGFRDRWLGPRS